ncbi:MAG: polysaccharide pyruvyl transferase family protein [bacterium]|nr:polysaccharide pyruvyl transferase family protein [bacterium]
MQDRKSLFILAGNGPYENRGCEAIIRGTVEILRHYFNDPHFVAVSNYTSCSQLKRQKLSEIDPAIIHKRVKPLKKFEFDWFLWILARFLYPPGKRYILYQEMLPYLKKAAAVLSVGGDNYSLDYGIPVRFTELDEVVLAKRKPMVIWGASVGPFDRIPEYERYMIEHLKRVTAIFARESVTIEYLAEHGIIKQVYRVADPAFLLKATRPSGEKFNLDIPEGAIGINLSPLMAKYAADGNLQKWVEQCTKIIRQVSEKTKRPLFLIYHVTIPKRDDYEFLKTVLAAVGKPNGEEIRLIPPGLNASELKWVIGKMSAFAGARTHATIAAISSLVPTLSFAYSIKAKGINRDIFGHEDYCLGPHQLKPEIVAERIEELIQNSGGIKKKIESVLPKIQNLAMDAGRYLKEIIVDGDKCQNLRK